MSRDNILFSNDAFGAHYAWMELFIDKSDQNSLYREAMKYFVNIINPFSSLALKKIEEIKSLHLKIDIIAPSHGVIWRDKPMQIVDKYIEWSSNYNLSNMSGFLLFLKSLKFKNKKAGVFGCYWWRGENINILKNKLQEAGFNVIDENIKALYNECNRGL